MESKITVRLKPMEQYSYKKKTVCKCKIMCKTAVQFIRTYSNEVDFVLCESDAKQLGIDILIQTKYMKSSAKRGQKDQYCRKGVIVRLWTAAEDIKLANLYKEDPRYKIIAKKLDRTVRAVEKRVGILRKAKKLFLTEIDYRE